jgi:hypothetical protein
MNSMTRGNAARRLIGYGVMPSGSVHMKLIMSCGKLQNAAAKSALYKGDGTLC